MRVLYHSRFQINIAQSIQLIDYNIDVVYANTGTQSRNAFISNATCVRYKFPFRDFVLNDVKFIGDALNATGVAHDDYLICYLLRLEPEVINGSCTIHYKFGWRQGGFYINV